MSDSWEFANNINRQIEILDHIKRKLPSTIQNCRAQHKTTMGEVSFERSEIVSFGLKLKIDQRYVIVGETKVVAEYSVYYLCPLEQKRHVVFQFFIIPLNEDALFALHPDSTDGFGSFNNNLEKNILGEYQKVLVASPAFKQLPI